MKKILLFIFMTFLSGLLSAQDTPPNGLKALTTASRYYNPADSSIWTYKGIALGWHREGKYNDVLNVKAKAGNGLSMNGDTVKLGGMIKNPTTLTINNNSSFAVHSLKPASDFYKSKGIGIDSSAAYLISIRASVVNDFTNVNPTGVGTYANDNETFIGFFKTPNILPTNYLNYFRNKGIYFNKDSAVYIDKENKRPIFYAPNISLPTDTNAIAKMAWVNKASNSAIQSIFNSQNNWFGQQNISTISFHDALRINNSNYPSNYLSTFIGSDLSAFSFNVGNRQVNLRFQPEVGGNNRLLVFPGDGGGPVQGGYSIAYQSDLLNKPDSAVIANSYVKKSGSAMTGDLTLSSATPINPLSAVTKKYVDDKSLENSFLISQQFYSLKVANNTWTGINNFNEAYFLGEKFGFNNNNFYINGDAFLNFPSSVYPGLRTVVHTGDNDALEVYRLGTGGTPYQDGKIIFDGNNLKDGNGNIFVKNNQGYKDSTYNSDTFIAKTGGTITGDLTLSSATPNNPLSAVPKAYIDNLITGITWKNAVRAKTIANITLSGLQTIDGVSLTAGNRVLVNNQTIASENGIYLVSPGAWARPGDADESAEVTSSTVAVTSGTINKNTQWTYIGTNDPTIGTDVISYGQISGSGTYSASNGIALSGNVFTLDQSFTNALYVSLSGSYSNPSWINSLAYSKLTGSPTDLNQFTNGPGFINQAQAKNSISASGSLSYNNITGVISYTQPTNVSSFTNDANYQTVAGADAKYLQLTGGTLSGLLNLSGGFTQLGANYNFYLPSAFQPASVGAVYSIMGSTSQYIRTGFYGNSSATLANGSNYASVEIASSPITTFASGTHSMITSFYVKPVAISSGGATVTNTATATFEAGTGGTNNYALYINSGNSFFNGAIVAPLGIQSSSGSNNAFINPTTTGVQITRNIADNNPALIINSLQGTKNIASFQSASTEVAYVNTGGGYFGAGVFNATSSNNSRVQTNTAGTVIIRDIADNNPSLVINLANSSSSAPISRFQFTGVNQAQINKNGDYENLIASGGIILRSPNGSRWKLTVTDAGASQWTAL